MRYKYTLVHVLGFFLLGFFICCGLSSGPTEKQFYVFCLNRGIALAECKAEEPNFDLKTGERLK